MPGNSRWDLIRDLKVNHVAVYFYDTIYDYLSTTVVNNNNVIGSNI